MSGASYIQLGESKAICSPHLKNVWTTLSGEQFILITVVGILHKEDCYGHNLEQAQKSFNRILRMGIIRYYRYFLDSALPFDDLKMSPGYTPSYEALHTPKNPLFCNFDYYL